MPAGRPTDYREEHCDSVIEWGKLGKSRAWISAELSICRQTLANWEDAHPEFLDAMTRAKLFSQRWWEDAGQNGMTSDKFNATVWAKNMNCRFRDEWVDKQEVQHSGGIAVTKIELVGVAPE